MIEEIPSRDEPLSGTPLGSQSSGQSSAANCQLPTPSSASRLSPVAPRSATSSQMQTTTARPPTLSSNGSHPIASSLLPSSIYQENVPGAPESYKLGYLWSQDPAFQSFDLEGTDMPASFSGIVPDVDLPLYSMIEETPAFSAEKGMPKKAQTPYTSTFAF